MTDALTIRDLRYRYPQTADEPAWTLSIARLDLGPGEQMLLTGGSGGGKSTLLHLIAGLLELEPARGGGSIQMHGQDIHALRGAARDRFRGRTIGMIFQTFNLLRGFSALENVMAALMFSEVPRREHRPRSVELLNHLGIAQPHREVDQLSVGQQQRVAVARAVVCRPALVLADEPTASLDPENAASAMELIQSACRESGAAMLCASHDPAIHSRFARRVSIDSLAGAPGTPADLVEAGKG